MTSGSFIARHGCWLKEMPTETLISACHPSSYSIYACAFSHSSQDIPHLNNTRVRKQLRHNHRCSRPEEVMDLPPSFLDGLSDEALQNVLRRTSDFPSKANWTGYIHPAQAMLLFEPSSRLAKAARATFTGVCTASQAHDASEAGTIFLPSAGSALARWLSLAGDSLISMRLDRDLGLLDGEALKQLLEPLKDKCVSLAELDVSAIAPDPFVTAVLQATAGRLRKLSVAGPMVADIREHCVGLQSLTLLKPPDDLPGLLQSVGPTLESLEISMYWQDCIADLQKVRAVSPSLTLISFWVESAAHPAYADLLASYGRQLLRTSLNRMSTPLCQTVVDACPNVRCRVMSISFDDMLQKMQVLGKSIDRLLLSVEHHFDQLELAFAAHVCTGIESIDLTIGMDAPNYAAEAVQALLFNKPGLRTFHLLMESGNAADAMLQVGSSAGNLREFSFYGSLQGLQEKRTLEAVVKGCPMLQNVDVLADKLVGHFEDFEKTVEYVVGCFLECQNLRKLCVSDENLAMGTEVPPPRLESIANKCVLARYRRGPGIFVSVLDEDYLV